jgi:hypothetical protein
MPKRERAAVSQELSQILGDSDTTDLLGSIIQSDRHKAGRDMTAVAEPETMTGHDASRHYDNKTSTQRGHRTSSQTCKHASPVASLQPDPTNEAPALNAQTSRNSTNQEPNTHDLLVQRLAEAKRMVQSATTTVTLRLPRELNDWLDEYVHRAWPERVRKQELVIEALRMLFVRRGRPHEPMLPTGFLPEQAP